MRGEPWIGVVPRRRLVVIGRAGLHAVSRVPPLILIGVFRAWQLLASPTYGQTCRFYPSCSAYGVEAVRRHGAVRGSWLTLRRICRCHPWNPGGVDLVPPSSRADADIDARADEVARRERAA